MSVGCVGAGHVRPMCRETFACCRVPLPEIERTVDRFNPYFFDRACAEAGGGTLVRGEGAAANAFFEGNRIVSGEFGTHRCGVTAECLDRNRSLFSVLLATGASTDRLVCCERQNQSLLSRSVPEREASAGGAYANMTRRTTQGTHQRCCRTNILDKRAVRTL